MPLTSTDAKAFAHLENRLAGCNKFYRLQVVPIPGMYSLRVQWGRIGTEGQTQEKVRGVLARCMAEFDKLLRQKLQRGYTEVPGSGVRQARDEDTKPKKGTNRVRLDATPGIALDGEPIEPTLEEPGKRRLVFGR